MFNFVEQPYTLIAVAILVAIIIWVYQAIVPDKKRWWHYLLPVIILIAAFALDYAVKTDIEKIRITLTKAGKAAQDEDIDAFESVFADNYSDSYHRSKDVLIQNFRARLGKPIIKRIVTRAGKVDLPKGSRKATVIFTARVIFEPDSQAAQGYKPIFETRLEGSLSKIGDDWFISKIELVNLDGLSASWADVQSAEW